MRYMILDALDEFSDVDKIGDYREEIADKICENLSGGDIHTCMQRYLNIAGTYYNIDPVHIITSREQLCMDIKHALRYKLMKDGFVSEYIAETEGISHMCVLRSKSLIESGHEATKILELFEF